MACWQGLRYEALAFDMHKLFGKEGFKNEAIVMERK